MTMTPPRADRALRACDVMTTPAIVVSPDTSLWDASRLMMSAGVRHLVVCFHGRVVGVIDDRSVFTQWPLGPVALRQIRLAELVRGPTSCVMEDVELQRVAQLMMIDGSDAVPVIDDRGTALGIITASDVVAAVASHGLTGEPT